MKIFQYSAVYWGSVAKVVLVDLHNVELEQV